MCVQQSKHQHRKRIYKNITGIPWWQWSLPGCGFGVVVDIVHSAMGQHPLLPATQRMKEKVLHLLEQFTYYKNIRIRFIARSTLFLKKKQTKRSPQYTTLIITSGQGLSHNTCSVCKCLTNKKREEY